MMRIFKPLNALLLSLPFFLLPHASLAQVDINGWRNTPDAGITQDTNVTFTLRMTLAGEETPRDSAFIGQDVSINTIIRPESGDVGQLADVFIVDYIPGAFLRMRNSDGNFVTWGGSLKNLAPYLESVPLEAELDVEVFSGQLGTTGNHRIFVGFLVGDALYFTPMAMRIDIGNDALTQAQELFNTEISPDIVQARCIQCHRSGGVADGQALHIFVQTSNPDHLTINFGEFREVHTARGTDYILSKVQGMLGHGGGVQLTSGSTNFLNLQDFLELLDQVE